MSELTREQIEQIKEQFTPKIGPEYVGQDIRALCTMALRSLRQPEREGWVLVPKEPTEAMLRPAMRVAYGPTVYENMDPDSIRIQEHYLRRIYGTFIAHAALQSEEK